jgi:radical SAM superfamily enzyme YgiQ (UPF0313 family)
LLCIDPWRKVEGSYRPFNYPVRKIEAAIRAHPALASVEVRVFDTDQADADKVTAAVEAFDPDVLGASAYLWSFPTFVEVARRTRARRPDTTVIFGGPSARPEMFALAPFAPFSTEVDALVLGEGEEVIVDLLQMRDRGRDALRAVPGLAVFGRRGWEQTPERPLPQLDGLPSPYQMGLVPQGYSAHLETFRGCPLSCSFCQWGDLSTTTRIFSKEYLIRELEAFARIGACGAIIVDAALNLNPRAFRNLFAAEREVGFLRTAHFNTEIYPSHMTDDHLAFLEMVEADSVGIGLQSYDKEVLKRVERPFQEERFERVVHDVARIVPDATVEIIVGLPGDNPDSFRRTLERARKLPVCVRVFRCVVLPNALMSRAPAHFAMDYDPVTLQMNSCWGWSRDDLDKVCEELATMVQAEGGDMNEGCNSWKLPSLAEVPRRMAERTHAASEAAGGGVAAPPSLRDLLARELADASQHRWSLQSARYEHDRLLLDVATGPGSLTVEIRRALQGQPSFRARAGLAFSYITRSAGEPAHADLLALERVTDRLGPLLRTQIDLPGRPSLPVLPSHPPEPSAPLRR